MPLYRHHILLSAVFHIIILFFVIAAWIYIGNNPLPVQLDEKNVLVEYHGIFNVTPGQYVIRVEGDYSKELIVIVDNRTVKNATAIDEVPVEIWVSVDRNATLNITVITFSGKVSLFIMQPLSRAMQDRLVGVAGGVSTALITVIAVISKDRRENIPIPKRSNVCLLPEDSGRFHGAVLGSLITAITVLVIMVTSVRYASMPIGRQLIDIAVSGVFLGFISSIALIKRGETKDMFAMAELISREFPEKKKCLDLSGWKNWGMHLFASNIKLVKMGMRMGIINGILRRGYLLCVPAKISKGEIQCEECGRLVPARDAVLVVVKGKSIFRCMECHVEITEQQLTKVQFFENTFGIATLAMVIIIFAWSFVQSLLEQAGYIITEIIPVSFISRVLLGIFIVNGIFYMAFGGYHERLPIISKLIQNNAPLPEDSKCPVHNRKAILRCARTGEGICDIEVEIARYIANTVPSRLELKLARLLTYMIKRENKNAPLVGEFVSSAKLIEPPPDITRLDISILMSIIFMSILPFLKGFEWIFPRNFFSVAILFLVIAFRSIIQSRGAALGRILRENTDEKDIFDTIRQLWRYFPHCTKINANATPIEKDPIEAFSAVTSMFNIKAPSSNIWKFMDAHGTILSSFIFSLWLSRIFHQKIVAIFARVFYKNSSRDVLFVISHPLTAGIKCAISRKLIPSLNILGLVALLQSSKNSNKKS